MSKEPLFRSDILAACMTPLSVGEIKEMERYMDKEANPEIWAKFMRLMIELEGFREA